MGDNPPRRARLTGAARGSMDAFKPIIAKVAAGSPLTRAESEAAFDTVLSVRQVRPQEGCDLR